MSKKPKLPKQPKPYPGSERFGDWTSDNVLWVNPSERVVPDPDNEDPNPLANVGGFAKPRHE